PFPMFFRGKPGTLAEMAKAFTGAVPVSGSDQLPLEMSMRPTAPDRFHIELSNLLSREFRGEMTVNGKVEQVAVAPNEKKNIEQALPEVLRADRMTKEKVTVTIDRKLSDTLEFEGIVCRKITGAPDWNRIPEVPFVNKVKPVPESDFSGSYQLAWDENNLYIRVNVRDDRFFHEEYAAGEKRWNNDSLQIFFDTLLNARLKKTRGFDGDDYDYAVFPDAAGTSARVWRNLQPDIQLTLGTTAPRNKAFEPEIPAKFTRTADGYIYEAVFPAKYLLPIRLKKGSAFGFSLFVNDRDDAGGNVKSCLTLTPDGTGSYNNPHLWPVMLLWDDK
ncbi:MAG: sugar-binding protein, partial [Victivallales bacterium]